MDMHIIIRQVMLVYYWHITHKGLLSWKLWQTWQYVKNIFFLWTNNLKIYGRMSYLKFWISVSFFLFITFSFLWLSNKLLPNIALPSFHKIFQIPLKIQNSTPNFSLTRKDQQSIYCQNLTRFSANYCLMKYIAKTKKNLSTIWNNDC